MKKKEKEEEKKGMLVATKVILILAAIFALFVIAIASIFAYVVSKLPLDLDINIPANILEKNVTESSYDHPLLNEEQEVFFENIGVDTAEIPTEFSEAQITCAVEKLGQERVDAIIGGSALTATDFFKAGSCF